MFNNRLLRLYRVGFKGPSQVKPLQESAISTLQHPDSPRFHKRTRSTGFVNAAYMTPMPIAALEALHNATLRYERPDFSGEDFFAPPERVRELLAKLVGGQASQFSLTGAASFGLSTLAWNLRVQPDALVGSKRTILGVNGQFPSNVQVWRRLERAGFSFRLVEGGPAATERLLKEIDDDTALVAVAPLAWTDGLRLDIDRIATRCADAQALLALDVTQSTGADGPLPDDLTCDVVVGAGYKWLLGPYGTGFLRLSSALQNVLEPLEANWKNFRGADDFNRLGEYSPEFMSPAAAFDHGQGSAFLRMAGFEVALQQLLAIGPDRVTTHARAFGMALAEGLNEARFTISDVSSPTQAAHLFRISPRDASTFDPLSARLADAGVSVSQRDGGWRISPHVYNDRADVDSILRILE